MIILLSSKGMSLIKKDEINYFSSISSLKDNNLIFSYFSLIYYLLNYLTSLFGINLKYF
jgi:hypothetical protein